MFLHLSKVIQQIVGLTNFGHFNIRNQFSDKIAISRKLLDKIVRQRIRLFFSPYLAVAHQYGIKI